ncbi:non-ribosomal peptide synthetase [Streptomyces avermitilis]|uniref:non-ribosomal peptide synthetase n=1 Tax=Streptomyces avermitilis TaxID=33903 RepID=UPI0038036C65
MDDSPVEVTAEQAEVWLAAQREGDSGRFNIPLDLEFDGPVDGPALRAALRDLALRHPALRSSFVTFRGELCRKVAADPAPRFVSRRRRGAYRRADALAWAAEVAAQPFDLAAPPLVRGALLEYDDGALFVLTTHHIVSDGWSQQISLRDLLTAYQARREGRSPGLLAPSTGTDPAASSRTMPAETLAHWRSLLAGAPETLAPPADLIRADTAPGTPAFAEIGLTGELLAGLRSLAGRRSATPAQILLTSWLCLLHAWSSRSDGTTGMLFASRLSEEAQDRVDLLARVLPVRSTVAGSDSFDDVLSRVQEQALDSLEHCEIPSDRLRELRTEAGTGISHDTCVFLHFPDVEDETTVEGVTIRVVEHEIAAAKYDFALAALEGASHLRLRVDYDSTLYRAATAKLFLRQLVALLTAAVSAPGTTLLQLLAGCDEEAPSFMPEPDDDLEPVLTHTWVLRHAAEGPHAVAVRAGADTLTYQELVQRASRLAHWLRNQGVGGRQDQPDIVALLLPPGIDTVVLWLASVLAGAAYLPLEPSNPDAQLERILTDASPTLLVVAPELAGRVNATGATVHLSTEAFAASAGLPAEPPSVDIGPDTPFNVLYTSGSTGRPKGVLLPHRGVARLLNRPDFVPLDHTDVLSQLSPLNFDGATYETWGALAHGGRLVVLERDSVLSPRVLAESLRGHGVTTLLVTTPLLNRLIDDAPDILSSLRRVYFGGEAISVPHMRRALRWCEPGTLLHGYGPTENSFTSTWLPVTEVPDAIRTLPIGRPVPGTTARVVLDLANMTPAPRGVPGELLLGGSGVALGYLGNPQATAERYLPDPSSGPGSLLYRTGDRVRFTPEGELEFIGRDDNQVKIRSQRVELGEVESALASAPDVDAVTVTVCRNERGEKELAAYAVLGPSGSPESVRQYARRILPSYAVPRFVVPLDEMPLNANGKMDRRRLPAPPWPRPRATGATRTPGQASAATTARAARPPAAGDSGRLADVRAAWRQVLGHDEFGVSDNFFDVGGHSLILVMLQLELERRLGAAPSISALLRHTTVQAQARLGGSPTAPREAGSVRTAPLAPAVPELAREWFAFPVSARTPQALTAARLGLAEHLLRHPGLRPADVSRTLTVGREAFSHRLTVVARGLEEAVTALRNPERPDDARLCTGFAEHRMPPRLILAFGDPAADVSDPVRAATLFASAHTLSQRLAEYGASPSAFCGAGAGSPAAAAAAGAMPFAEAARLFTHLASRSGAAPASVAPETAPDTLFVPSFGQEHTAALVGRASAGQTNTVVGIGLSAEERAAITDLPGTTLLTAEAWQERDERALLCLLAELWCTGAAAVDVGAGVPGRRVRLPGYPFQRVAAR